jgi:cyclohexanecarboxyl-CoA dehydrogenase
MGMERLGRASITFEDVKLPKRYLLGSEGQGFYMTMGVFDFMRVCIGIACLGVAQASLEDAMTYARQRVAFGKPIAKFEGVSFKIVENATLVEAARLLCYRTLWLKDQGQVHTKESAMCKWWAVQVAVRAIHDALLIHGHIGYSKEYPLEQRLRDTIGFEIGDGTAEIMKIIICRELLGKEFLPY